MLPESGNMSIKLSSYPKKNNFILRCNGSPNTAQGSDIPDKNRSPGYPRLLFVLTNFNLKIMELKIKKERYQKPIKWEKYFHSTVLIRQSRGLLLKEDADPLLERSAEHRARFGF